MASSEEYLANLGFDTKDAEKATEQLITLVGHLGAQFDELEGKTSKAERALLGEARASKSSSSGAQAATSAAKTRGKAIADMTDKEREFQAFLAQGVANDKAFAASRAKAFDGQVQKDYGKSLGEMTAKEREFQKFLADGAANDAAYASSQKRTQSLNQERDATNRAAQAKSSLIAEQRGEEQARQSELAALRASIQGRYADADASSQQTQNLSRLRYAVYDVSNALAIGGVAALGFATAIVGTGVNFEREFASVSRTVVDYNQDAATIQATNERLYKQFLDLSTQIPTSFSDLTAIGTLAGQLGVAEGRVISFTDTVAKFSATTDVTVDASATAFGRLDALLPDVEGNYNKLGSSILKVGINSVATESQIVSISGQIAAVGAQAGLSSDEVIGLSAALASVGVAPEAARGTILRTFSLINSAVSQGGESLQKFAAISGKSADEFKQGWEQDFTGTFLAFLNGVNANGSGAETALRSLGVTATRDVNTMLKLSQNTDLVSQALADAKNGANDTDFLNENFGIIAETNGAKLQRLVQSVQALLATVGGASSGPLSQFLDLLLGITKALTDFSSTSLGQRIAIYATVFSTILGAVLLLSAGVLRGVGTFLALRTALAETNAQVVIGTTGFRGFAAALLGAKTASDSLAASQGQVAASSSKAVSAGSKLSSVLGKIGLVGAIASLVFAIPDLLSGLTDISTQMQGVSADADGMREAILRASTAATSDAGVQDIAKKFGNDNSFNVKTSKGIDQVSGLKGLVNYNATGQVGSKGQVPTQFDLSAGSSQITAVETARKNVEAFDAAITKLQGEGKIDAVNKALEIYYANANKAGVESADAAALLTQYNAATSQTGDAARDAADGVDDQASAIDDTIGVYLDAINAQAQMQDSLYGLGDSLAQNGNDFSIYSEGGRANLEALQQVIKAYTEQAGGDSQALANNLQGLFDAIVNGGYASAGQLGILQQAIASLGVKGVVPVTQNVNSLAAGFQAGTQKARSTGRAARDAAKEVRTLVDYANDLKNVFSRAFDIRFGGTQGMDQITSSWNKIRDAIAETNQQIRDYQVEMQQLSADKAVREYWLKVAENYGDALRAGELRAEIADIDNQLTKKSGDLTKAQEQNSKTLVGNSDAAIANRAEILGLVQNYQDYIATLAAAGVPQSQLQATANRLRAEFITQATQLGYNSDQLGVYAAAFDDVTLAIQRVPRNITVAANTNPALQALNELEARARGLASQTYAGPTITGGTFNDDASAKAARLSVLRAEMIKLNNEAERGVTPARMGAIQNRLQQISAAINSGSYRSGTAWTGSGNPWEIAGVVHNREAVLNETGTSMVPRQFIEAANQGRNPWGYGPTQVQASMPGRMVVELSPVDRQLLAEGATVTVMLGADQVARATSAFDSDDTRRGGS